jgi:hypothetical protein
VFWRSAFAARASSSAEVWTERTSGESGAASAPTRSAVRASASALLPMRSAAPPARSSVERVCASVASG